MRSHSLKQNDWKKNQIQQELKQKCKIQQEELKQKCKIQQNYAKFSNKKKLRQSYLLEDFRRGKWVKEEEL